MVINIGEFRKFDVCYQDNLGNCTTYRYILFAGFTTSVVSPISNTDISNLSKATQTNYPAQSALGKNWTTNTSAPTTISSGTVSNNTKATTGIVPSSPVTNSSVNGYASTLLYSYTGVTNITGLSKLVNKLSSASPTTIGQNSDPSKSLTSKYLFISNYYTRVYCFRPKNDTLYAKLKVF